MNRSSKWLGKKRVTLPKHFHLWHALVAIQYCDTTSRKNFSDVLSMLRELRCAHNQSGSVDKSPLPFHHHQNITTDISQVTEILRQHPMSRTAKAVADGVSTAQSIYQDAQKAIDGLKVIFGEASFNPIAFEPRNPFTILKDTLQGLGQATYQTYAALNYYDLLAWEHEYDPDECTCFVPNSFEQPCELIARYLLEQKEKSMFKKAISIGTVKVSDALEGIFKTTIKPMKPIAEPIWHDIKAKIFGSSNHPSQTTHQLLSSNDAIANYLWRAAQTSGLYQGVQVRNHIHTEHNASGAFPQAARINAERQESYREDITYQITEPGCPKAIAIIALLLGEFSEQSNYLKTLAAISANDGVRVIRSKL